MGALGVLLPKSGIVKDLLHARGYFYIDDLQTEERAILKMIHQLGGSSKRFVREQRKQTKWLLTEV